MDGIFSMKGAYANETVRVSRHSDGYYTLSNRSGAVLDVAVHGRPRPVAHLDQIGRRVETPHIIDHTLGHMKTPTHPARSVPEPAWYRVGVHSVLYVTRTTYRRAAGISEGLSHASRR